MTPWIKLAPYFDTNRRLFIDIIDAEGNRVCTVPVVDARNENNARAIAMVPELIAFAEAYVKFYDGSVVLKAEELMVLAKAARALLARIKGK